MPSKRAAFSLIELIVVILIIGVLVALMVPGLHKTWRVVDANRCQLNLRTIYKVQTLWAADRLTDANSNRRYWSEDTTSDSVWAGSVLTYLDGQSGSLICPSAGTASATASGSSGGSYATGGEEITYEGQLLKLEEITVGVTDDEGNTLYEIPLNDNTHWSIYQSWKEAGGRVHIGANIDGNYGTVPAGDSLTRQTRPALESCVKYGDEDFLFYVIYDDKDVPCQLIIGDCDGNADAYWSDLRIRHKPIWGGERFHEEFAKGHVGDVISLTKYGRRVYSSTWTVWSGATTVLGTSKYGISRGCYQDESGNDMLAPDARAIFILDYPRPVADYTNINDGKVVSDKSYWSQIFIDPAPPTDWTAPPELDGGGWQDAQALRHEGKANVLFCDGHIEALGPEELTATCPYWRYNGR